jgi:hypothetical protein
VRVGVFLDGFDEAVEFILEVMKPLERICFLRRRHELLLSWQPSAMAAQAAVKTTERNVMLGLFTKTPMKKLNTHSRLFLQDALRGSVSRETE